MTLHDKRRTSGIFLFIPFLVLGVCLLTLPAWADVGEDTYFSGLDEMVDSLRGSLRNDTFEIRPRYRQEMDLDSNILLESADEKFDVIFREKPGVQVSVPFGDHFLRADYEAWLEHYVKFPVQNEENQYFNADLALNFTDYYVNVHDGLRHTVSRSGTTFTERIPRFEHEVNAMLGRHFNRMTVETGYHDFYRSFDAGPVKDRNYHAIGGFGRVFVDTTAKTKAFLEYDFTRYEYFKDSVRDQTGNRIFAGLTGAILPKTTLFSKFGYERLNSDTSSRSNGDNFVVELGALYTMSAKTKFDLGWVRTTEQSTFSITNYYLQERLYGRIRQKVTEKVSGQVEVAYIRQDYEDVGLAADAGGFTGERDDDLVTVDARLFYKLTDWLSADARYLYSRRDSNASLFDYTDNLFGFGVNVQV